MKRTTGYAQKSEAEYVKKKTGYVERSTGDDRPDRDRGGQGTGCVPPIDGQQGDMVMEHFDLLVVVEGHTPVRLDRNAGANLNTICDPEVGADQPGPGNPSITQTLLAAREQGGHVVGLCRGREEMEQRRLAIKTNGRRVWLARYPDSGHHHRSDCVWHTHPADWSGRAAYTPDVITTRGGVSSIKFRIDRQARIDPEPFHDPQPYWTRNRWSVKRRRDPVPTRMTECGLLDFLWEEAGLNIWHPRFIRRSWPIATNQVLEAAERILWGRQPLADALLVATGGTEENRGSTIADNLNKLATAGERKRRVMLLTGLTRPFGTDVEADKRVFVPTLTGYADYRFRTFTDAAIARQTAERYPNAWQALQEREKGTITSRIIALIVAVPNPDRASPGHWFLNTVDMALMQTTGTFLPFHNTYERMLIDRLVEQDRTFMKPLRYDNPPQVLANIVLLDTDGGPQPLELRNRKMNEDQIRNKTVYFSETFGQHHWWYWQTRQESLDEATGRIRYPKS